MAWPASVAGNQTSRMASDLVHYRREDEGATGEEHHDYGFAERGDAVDELLLIARQVDVGACCRFSAEAARFAEGHYDDVGLASCVFRRGEACIGGGGSTSLPPVPRA